MYKCHVAVKNLLEVLYYNTENDNTQSHPLAPSKPMSVSLIYLYWKAIAIALQINSNSKENVLTRTQFLGYFIPWYGSTSLWRNVLTMLVLEMREKASQDSDEFGKDSRFTSTGEVGHCKCIIILVAVSSIKGRTPQGYMSQFSKIKSQKLNVGKSNKLDLLPSIVQ